MLLEGKSGGKRTTQNTEWYNYALIMDKEIPQKFLKLEIEGNTRMSNQNENSLME